MSLRHVQKEFHVYVMHAYTGHTQSVRLRPCWPEENLVTFQHDLENPTLTLNGKPTLSAVNAAEAASSKGQRKLKGVSSSFCREAAPLSISQ